MPGYDHKALCRHASTGDQGLKLIFSEIRQCLPKNSLAKASKYTSPYVNDCYSSAISSGPLLSLPTKLRFCGATKYFASFTGRLQQTSYGSGSGALRPWWDRVGFSPCHLSTINSNDIRKSQIAVEYAYNLLERNPETLIFWVFGGSKERFEQDYLGIARRLQLPGFHGSTVDVLALVKTALEKRSNWAMIIDNADDSTTLWGTSKANYSETSIQNDSTDREGLAKYIPRGLNGFILYTTRTKDDALRLTGEGQVIKVSEMDEEDLKSLLKSKFKNEAFSDNDLTRLITTLDRLPLAIVQAASFIRHKSWSITQYLTNFEAEGSVSSSGPLLHDFRDKTRDYKGNNPVFRTWIITMKQLEEQEPKAADLLRLMSCYNRQDIPHDLLLGPDSNSIGYQEEKANKNYYLAMSISTLLSYSFLTVSEGPRGQRYTLHRLVQKFIQYRLEDLGIADKWATNALDFLVSVFPLEEYESWELSAELLPHVQAMAEYKMNSNLPAGKLGILLTAASAYLRRKGQLQRADKYITLALTTLRTNLGNDDPTTIDALCEQGHCFQDLKQYERAEKVYCSAIDSYSRVFGSQDVKIYKAKIFLSGILRIQKRYPEAESEARIALRELKNFDGEEAERARLLGENSLSKVLGDTRRYDDAIRIQRNLDISLTNKYGPEHPRVFNNLHDLAVTLMMIGQPTGLKEARHISQRVMDLCEKMYGPDHHQTANIVYNYGLVLMKQAYFEDADAYLKRALRFFNTHGGEIYPLEALNCISYLGVSQESQGHYIEALKYCESRYKISLSSFGVTHERTQLAQREIARIQGLIHHDPNSSSRQHSTDIPIHYVSGANMAANGNCYGSMRSQYRIAEARKQDDPYAFAFPPYQSKKHARSDTIMFSSGASVSNDGRESKKKRL
jgi:tetratricopeptide (TPR) repeat protein